MPLARPLAFAAIVSAALVAQGCGRSDVFKPGTQGAGGGHGGGTGGGGTGGGGTGGGGTGGGGTGGGGTGGGGTGGGGTSIDVPCDEPVVAPTLAALRANVLGSWRGTRTCPWQGPITVDFVFRQDGTYSAKSLSPNSPALYYGSDADSPAKKYSITDLRTNGDGRGIINVFFGPNSAPEGELDRIRVCAQSNRLDFVVFPAWLGHIGPLEYRLARTP